MKKHLFNALTMLAVASPAMAQEVYPAVEFSVGYSILNDNEIKENLGGFVASATGNVNRWLSVESEFGGNFDLDVWSYVGGPRFTLRTERASHYLHLLFGGVRQTASIQGGGAPAFEAASQAGGGVSVRMTPKLALNIGGDFRRVHSDFGSNRNEVRFNIGFAFGAGSRF